jgi:hypothetical protein
MTDKVSGAAKAGKPRNVLRSTYKSLRLQGSKRRKICCSARFLPEIFNAPLQESCRTVTVLINVVS